jgi:hypothetical protein
MKTKMLEHASLLLTCSGLTLLLIGLVFSPSQVYADQVKAQQGPCPVWPLCDSTSCNNQNPNSCPNTGVFCYPTFDCQQFCKCRLNMIAGVCQCD